MPAARFERLDAVSQRAALLELGLYAFDLVYTPMGITVSQAESLAGAAERGLRC